MDKRVKILLFVFNLTIQVLGQDMKTIDSIYPPITIIDSTFRLKVDSVITSGYYKVKSIGTENLINYINISNDSSCFTIWSNVVSSNCEGIEMKVDSIYYFKELIEVRATNLPVGVISEKSSIHQKYKLCTTSYVCGLKLIALAKRSE